MRKQKFIKENLVSLKKKKCSKVLLNIISEKVHVCVSKQAVISKCASTLFKNESLKGSLRVSKFY